ncbi:hypothetical protein BJY04DRAFT_183998 [Aspergillus karnatakaensis]|uniref:uncharacterized protein n=1 Tax=Aspergillus karnatakaensis TaxID=1810916 RepID=UPI003CCD9F9B
MSTFLNGLVSFLLPWELVGTRNIIVIDTRDDEEKNSKMMAGGILIDEAGRGKRGCMRQGMEDARMRIQDRQCKA